MGNFGSSIQNCQDGPVAILGQLGTALKWFKEGWIGI
jgi:hypothetical protein